MDVPVGPRVARRVGNRKHGRAANRVEGFGHRLHVGARDIHDVAAGIAACRPQAMNHDGPHADTLATYRSIEDLPEGIVAHDAQIDRAGWRLESGIRPRSEEHTSELQSLMRISYAVFCLKKKKTTPNKT